MIKLFDLHCDTATRLLAENQGLADNSLHISLSKAQYLEKYAQVMAIWTDRRLSDGEGYERFFGVLDNLEREIEKNSDRVAMARSYPDIERSLASGISPLILAVEDARILENNISRLDALYDRGVRILTLNWYGNTCIGGGHDTTNGLTDFGKEVVRCTLELGIIPDISHCSQQGSEEVLTIAEELAGPIIASHSDSFSVNPHTRNLSDSHLERLIRLGGLVGLNLCPSHLSQSGSASVNDILRHAEHYLSLGGEDILAMGGDLDGTDLPQDIGGIEDMYKIAEAMQRINYSDRLIEKIFYENALNFFKRNI